MKHFESIQNQIIATEKKVRDGHMNPLTALLNLRKDRYELQNCLKLIDEFESEYLEKIAQEVDNWGGHYQGYEFQVRSGGRSWNFKNIPEWQQAEAVKKAIEAKYKSYFEAAQKGAMMATEDGEEIVMPEISYRRASVVISKPKQ